MPNTDNKPDFICGGMSKSATEWLYNFFMMILTFVKNYILRLQKTGNS